MTETFQKVTLLDAIDQVVEDPALIAISADGAFALQVEGDVLEVRLCGSQYQFDPAQRFAVTYHPEEIDLLLDALACPDQKAFTCPSCSEVSFTHPSSGGEVVCLPCSDHFIIPALAAPEVEFILTTKPEQIEK